MVKKGVYKIKHIQDTSCKIVPWDSDHKVRSCAAIFIDNYFQLYVCMYVLFRSIQHQRGTIYVVQK